MVVQKGGMQCHYKDAEQLRKEVRRGGGTPMVPITAIFPVAL